MFRRSSDGIWHSDILDNLPWVEHGFATRHRPDWPGDYARVRQVHSALVQEASGDAPQGDGLITRERGRWIGIRTADCVPVLLADVNHRAVAAIHAGWRGTAGKIVRVALDQMHQRYGTTSEDVRAAIGPCIAQCCFEVGPEVGAEFPNEFQSDPPRVDLVRANQRQLLEWGVDTAAVDIAGLCTMCDSGEFESYRRDREQSGRMVSAIRIAA